jgi:hypothetical protein
MNTCNTQVKWQIEDEDKVESLVLAHGCLATNVNTAVDAGTLQRLPFMQWWKAHVQRIEPVSPETTAPHAGVLR